MYFLIKVKRASTNDTLIGKIWATDKESVIFTWWDNSHCVEIPGNEPCSGIHYSIKEILPFQKGAEYDVDWTDLEPDKEIHNFLSHLVAGM